MAMQPSSKGGADPTLSDDEAEGFAASFKPAWDTEGADDAKGAGLAAPLKPFESDTAPGLGPIASKPEAPAIAASPAPVVNKKHTMIGVAPPTSLASAPQPAPQPPAQAAPHPAQPVARPTSSAEPIESANVLEVHTAPPAPAAPPPPMAQMKPGMGTQMMVDRPVPSQQRAPATAAAVSQNGPSQRSNPPPPRVAIQGVPARGPSTADEFEVIPKRSGKTTLLVIAGLLVVAGLGVGLKFAMTEDAPKAAPTQLVTGPAVTTAEIPLPPPKVEAPPVPATAVVAPAKTAEPAPAPLAPPPPVAARGAAAPRNEPRPALPPPQPARPAAPRTPPKPPNGSIVRDNPF